MNKKLLLLCALSVFHIEYTLSLILPLPFDEYSFVLARNELQAVDASPNATALSSKEKLVSIYFEKLKADEFKRTGLSDFYPLKPLENELDAIVSTDLYAILKDLPKGGNLHIHEFQMLNRRKLLEIVQASAEYDYLYICDKSKPYCQLNKCACGDYILKYFKNLTETTNDGWVKVKGSGKQKKNKG